MISRQRRKKTYKVIRKRLKQIEDNSKDTRYDYLHACNKDLDQPHRLAKRKAFGCHRAQCKCCHADKLDDKIRETEPDIESDFV